MSPLLALLVALSIAVPPAQGARGSNDHEVVHETGRFVSSPHDANPTGQVTVSDLPPAPTAAVPDTAASSDAGPRLGLTSPPAHRADGPAPSLVLGPATDAANPDQTSILVPTDPAEPFFSSGWEGMNDLVNVAVGACAGGGPRPCLQPPDPFVAVGPADVVQMVNVAVRITDRAGGSAVTVSTASFFGQLPLQVKNADGRVLYDAAKGRWLATQLSYDCAAGHLYLAVSDTADPRGSWTSWAFSFPGEVPDYPGLGMSDDKVLLSANLYPIEASLDPPGCVVGDFTGATLLALDWADIVDGGGLTSAEFGPDPTSFTWRPASAQGPGTTAFAIVVDLQFGFADVGYATISGNVANDTVAVSTFRNLTNEGLAAEFIDPPAPRQPGSPATIAAAADFRPTDAVWRIGRLWFAATTACQIDTIRACPRITEIDTTNPAAPNPVLVDALLGWWGMDSFMPGVGLTASGTMFAVYSRSSSAAPVSIQAVHVRTGELEFRGWHTVRNGAGTFNGSRWGDYVGVAPDPMDSQAVWQADEYPDGSGGWATFVSKLSTGVVGTPGTTSRLSGADRYATAATISASTFEPGVAAAYVATGTNYPDALAGGAAAAVRNAPLLLVTPSTLPAATAAELDRLNPAQIFVLGGTGAISDTVVGQLGVYTTGTVTRLSGSNRYATAAAISAATFPVGTSAAYVSVGTNYPDALAGGPAAGLEDSPLLLLTKTTIPAETAAELTRLKPASIVVLGGTGVISDAVRNALVGYTAGGGSGSVIRLAGADRYATAAAISAVLFPTGVSTAYIATGTNYPDALAGGAAASFEDAPLLLVTASTIPAATAAELSRLKPRRIVVLGGPSVVSNAVLSALDAYVYP